MIKLFRLALHSAWRDARAGELRLLVVAVALGVASLTSVAFLADRIEGGLQRDARKLLGGDAVVVTDKPPPAVLFEKIQSLGLKANTSMSFPTMARTTQAQGSASKLVALKAVQESYPLRGQLKIMAPLDTPEQRPATVTQLDNASEYDRPAVATNQIPAAGEVWVEPGLLEALDIKPGSDLKLGQKTFHISQVLMYEPDRGAGFMNFSPRVLMNEADVKATGLVQPASRINWRVAVVGDSTKVDAWVTWAQSWSKQADVKGVRVETLEMGRPDMRQTLDRASKFLHLVALLASLLTAVAVALSARTFASKHLDDCAIKRVLGQSQRDMTGVFVIEFIGAGLLASLVGLLIGYGVHNAFVAMLEGLVETQLPAPTWQPIWQGLGSGLTLLIAFGLPPVLQLSQVPPLRVIRRHLGRIQPASWGVMGLGLLGFSALMIVFSRDLLLGTMVVVGFAFALLLFASFAWASLWLLKKFIAQNKVPHWLQMATRQILSKPAYAMVQVSALSVGLLALMLLVLLRTDLISSWRNATPVDAPNRFVINIQPEQSQEFLKAIQTAGVQRYDWYPMIRGRLVAINQKNITSSDFKDERAQRLVEREFNLSHSAQAPAHNSIVGGTWLPEEKQSISIEEGIAKTLQVQLGDWLTFDMAGVIMRARVTSIRRVDWTSMRANFFVMFPVSQMPETTMTYIAAYRAPSQKGFDNALVNQFPNITNVDMGVTLNQVQQVLNQVIQAVELLFGFTLASGLLVLFSAVTATREERAREYAILRALGGSNTLLIHMQRAELIGVGVLAGFLASLVSMAMAWGLTHFVFEFSWQPSLLFPLGGMLAGASLAWLAGWWGLNDILKRPVIETLRQAAE